MGINAIGYDAQDVKNNSMKMSVREVFARVKTFIDLYVLNTKPRFLGEAIRIG
ncbi:MAG: SanA protein, partial [Bacteroidetes bacterium]|nr:SanA protein [Bacteroidota bacterium]